MSIFDGDDFDGPNFDFGESCPQCSEPLDGFAPCACVLDVVRPSAGSSSMRDMAARRYANHVVSDARKLATSTGVMKGTAEKWLRGEPLKLQRSEEKLTRAAAAMGIKRTAG